MRFLDKLMLLAHKLLGRDGSPEAHNEARLDVVDKRLDRLAAAAEAFHRAEHAKRR